MRTAPAFLSMLLLASLAAAQARSPFSLSLVPSAQLPMGAQMGKLYSLGYGAELEGGLALPGAGPLAAGASLGFVGIPIAGTRESLSILSLGAGPSIALRPLDRLELELSALGGYALLLSPGVTTGNPFASAALRASFSLSPSFSLGLGAAYRMHFNATGLDYQGLGLGLGASFGLGGGAAPKMRILDVRFDPVFPVFYKYYETNPAGSLRIRNGESGTATDLVVSFYLPQYMAGPKECASLAGGGGGRGPHNRPLHGFHRRHNRGHEGGGQGRRRLYLPRGPGQG
jgi:hypothetical protein